MKWHINLISCAIAAAAIPATFIFAQSRPADKDEPVANTFDANGVKIRYFVQGKGEPVVLIHGLHGSAESNWKMPGVMAALAKDHQVIALDLPGHGGSDKPEKESAYGAQMAEDVILLMDHLKITKAHVVGYSMGGMIVMKLLATHPDRITSAVVGGMGWMREGGALAKIWEELPPREGGRTPAACISQIGKLGITEEQLKAIKTPATVIVGSRDPVKKLYVDPMLTVRKDWPVVEIQDAGHLNCIMKKQFLEEIVSWVARQR
ncbi:MAG: alpha/beta hydrolase [Planctomycetes bacterium]|nr:alpha/beta hydrolase [Planctomycetota bacterium]